MKLSSLRVLFTTAYITLKRFPLEILFAWLLTITLIIWVHIADHTDESNIKILRYAMTFYLGIAGSLSISMFRERYKPSFRRMVGIYLIFFTGLFAYGWNVPVPFRLMSIYQFVVLALSFHLLVSFIPYVRGEAQLGFWQYNKTFFLRFLNAAIFGGVLFGGLALALLGIHFLFEISINDNFYLDLFIVISGLFLTWFFLSGIPEDLEGLDEYDDYPWIVKAFTQFILIPLATIYLVILYAYMVKILITTTWPVGWVSYLVLYYSVVGILSMLLIWPRRTDSSSSWLRWFNGAFYISLLPLLAMLMIAICKRIGAYGVTVERYYVLLLGIWLFLISLYFLFSKIKNIRVIPVSLCLFGLLSTFGPFGADAVSIRSQTERLTSFLKESGMYSNGKILKSDTVVKERNLDEIRSVAGYLVESHGYASLQPFFDLNLDSVFSNNKNTGSVYNQREIIFALMGFESMPLYNKSFSGFTCNRIHENVLPSEGMKIWLNNFYFNENEPAGPETFVSGDDSVRVSFSHPDRNLILHFKNDTTVRMKVPSLSVVQDSTGNFTSVNLGDNLLVSDFDTLNYRLRLVIQEAGGFITSPSKAIITHGRFCIGIGKK